MAPLKAAIDEGRLPIFDFSMFRLLNFRSIEVRNSSVPFVPSCEVRSAARADGEHWIRLIDANRNTGWLLFADGLVKISVD